jgi:hypothetical protein
MFSTKGAGKQEFARRHRRVKQRPAIEIKSHEHAFQSKHPAEAGFLSVLNPAPLRLATLQKESTDDLPRSIAGAAGTALARCVVPPLASAQRKLAAGLTITLEAVLRRDHVSRAVVYAGPRHALVRPRELKRMPDARFVGAAHVAGNLGADDRTRYRTDENRDVPTTAFADLRADRPPTTPPSTGPTACRLQRPSTTP